MVPWSISLYEELKIMPNSITLEDFYKIFQESDRQREETERILRESFQRSQEEADRRAAEADRRAAEADRRAAEADRTMEELKKFVANTSREVGNLTSRWGQFVENLVEPGVVRLFQARGIAVKETHPRIKAKRSTVAMEIDILAVDDNVAVAVEVKSRLSTTDVDEFREKLGKFKQAFPAYKNYNIHGAVAGIEIDEGMDRYAYRQGLFVIKQSGETVEIANDEAFKPKRW